MSGTRNNGGDSTTGPADLTVNNLNPVLTVATDKTVNEGQLLDLTGNANPLLGLFIDTGTLDLHTATVDWGDGSPIEAAIVNEAGGSGSVGGSHTYADNGTYTVTVTVSDDDLGTSNVGMFKVTVKNVPLDVDAPPSPPINENDFAHSHRHLSRPGVLDTQQLDIDWNGDGTFDQTVAVSGGAFSVQHQYFDDGPSPGNGTPSDTFTVHVRLRDNGGDSTTGQTDLTVNNLNPVLTVATDKTVDEGQLLDLTGNANPLLGLVIDTGTLDLHTATVDWGDGSPIEAATVNEAGGSGSLSGSHTYADNGMYTVKVTVSDDDGGTSNVGMFKVHVNNVPPTLSTISLVSASINENQTATGTLSISDPGSQDTFSVQVNWDEGTPDLISLGLTDSSGGTLSGTSYVWTAATRTLQVSHQYLDDNPAATTSDNHTLTVKVADDDMTGNFALLR